MKTTTPKISKADKLSNELDTLITTLIFYKWNCTSLSSVVTRFIRILGPEFSNLQAMFNFLKAEQIRMTISSGTYGFNNYYGSGILETMDNIMKLAPKLVNDNTVLSAEQIVGIRIKKAFKDSYCHKEFNWDNFNVLREVNMMESLHEFDTNFRGDIKKVHKVHEDRYVIFETKRLPFGEKKGPLETNFYAFNKTDKGYRHDATCYNTFEDALFSVMCPTYSRAMSALLAQSKTQD